MHHFILRELLHRYTNFKDLHWFKGNIQKTFEIVLENMLNILRMVLITCIYSDFIFQLPQLMR